MELVVQKVIPVQVHLVRPQELNVVVPMVSIVPVQADKVVQMEIVIIIINAVQQPAEYLPVNMAEMQEVVAVIRSVNPVVIQRASKFNVFKHLVLA